MQNNPALVAVRAAQANVSATISAEISKLASSMTSTVMAARAREASLHERLNSLRDLVASQSDAEIKLRDLQNQADAAREVYLSYLHRFQQTASLGLMQQPDAELIALADLPLHPAGPRRIQIVVLAGAVGIIIAVLCALLCDRFRRGFFTPADLEAATGLTVIGFIPRLRRGMEALSSAKIQFLFREAMNHVRATLEFGSQQYRAQVVLVTSALPGEGKTHFATSLARSVTARGGRALLIECDLRRPSSSQGHLAIVRDLASGIDVGTLQTSRAHPSFLPSLNRARAEMDAVRQKYDLIVLDGPPVLACAEAELLCDVVDGIIMVVRWGHTTKGSISSALRTLRLYGIRTIGAVMTNADIKQLTKTSSDYGHLYRRYAE
jgi:Mrp family chromosome partitioning ATPase